MCFNNGSSEKDELNIIDADTLMKEYFGKEDVLIVDNRPEKMFNNGHIKGAVNLRYWELNSPENVMTKEKLLEIAKDKKIVFHCTGQNRAYNATITAINVWKIDKNKIYWYKGGFTDWQNKKLPVAKD